MTSGSIRRGGGLLLSVALTACWSVSPSAWSQVDQGELSRSQQEALAALKGLDAHVTLTREETSPERSVVGMKIRRFSGIGDATLKHVIVFPELRTLELDGSELDEYGRSFAPDFLPERARQTVEAERLLTDRGLADLARLSVAVRD